MRPPTDLELAWRDALLVQDACNLSGVLESWHRHLPAIRAACPNGTDEFRWYPVNVLFASKVASLTGCEDDVQFSQAYERVKSFVEWRDSVEERLKEIDNVL